MQSPLFLLTFIYRVNIPIPNSVDILRKELVNMNHCGQGYFSCYNSTEAWQDILHRVTSQEQLVSALSIQE